MIATFNTSVPAGREGLQALERNARYRILEMHTATDTGGCYATVRYEHAPQELPFTCDGCGLPIRNVEYASMGGNIVPYIPAKNYHIVCIPRVPRVPATRRREVTAEQLREWAHSEGFVDDYDTPYNVLAARINSFFEGN